MHTERKDGVKGFKRRCYDLSSDGVMDLTMASERSLPKETLEDSARFNIPHDRSEKIYNLAKDEDAMESGFSPMASGFLT
ncbi:hypothetical protein Tco_1513483 [Tanacetum coccineum]